MRCLDHGCCRYNLNTCGCGMGGAGSECKHPCGPRKNDYIDRVRLSLPNYGAEVAHLGRWAVCGSCCFLLDGPQCVYNQPKRDRMMDRHYAEVWPVIVHGREAVQEAMF
jgi:hypothetical protein